MRLAAFFIILILMGQGTPPGPPAKTQKDTAPALEKSAYFAFVDRDYIFTLEVVAPGVPLLNFVSMTDDAKPLTAKQIRMALENRKVPGNLFLVDTGNPKEPLALASVTMRPRSSFGVRVTGDLEAEKELTGVTVRVGNEDFKLAPLSSLAFENLVLKVNRINLASPDFRDDWQALKLEALGTREPAPRR